MTHDFRSIYGYSIFDVGTKVPWAEALVHLQVLKSHPQSLLYVALSDGAVTRPWNYFEAVLYDILDVLLAANSKNKPKPIPRPWKALKKRLGKGSLPYQVGLDFFARLGHKPNLDQ